MAERPRRLRPRGRCALKRAPGQDILVLNSASIIRALLVLGLVDELRILVVPAVDGLRFFPQGLASSAWRLLHHVLHRGGRPPLRLGGQSCAFRPRRATSAGTRASGAYGFSRSPAARVLLCRLVAPVRRPLRRPWCPGGRKSRRVRGTSTHGGGPEYGRDIADYEKENPNARQQHDEWKKQRGAGPGPQRRRGLPPALPGHRGPDPGAGGVKDPQGATKREAEGVKDEVAGTLKAGAGKVLRNEGLAAEGEAQRQAAGLQGTDPRQSGRAYRGPALRPGRSTGLAESDTHREEDRGRANAPAAIAWA